MLLDEDVVSSYWVGGPSLDKVDPAAAACRLRTAFKGQVTGLLDASSRHRRRYWHTTAFMSSSSIPGCGSCAAMRLPR